MKCECGYERAVNSALCRMVETKQHDTFRVEIYDPDGKLIAHCDRALDAERALAFVAEHVDFHKYTTHFHWEESKAHHASSPSPSPFRGVSKMEPAV